MSHDDAPIGDPNDQVGMPIKFCADQLGVIVRHITRRVALSQARFAGQQGDGVLIQQGSQPMGEAVEGYASGDVVTRTSGPQTQGLFTAAKPGVGDIV